MNKKFRNSKSRYLVIVLICLSLSLISAKGLQSNRLNLLPTIYSHDHYISTTQKNAEHTICEQWDSKAVQKPGVIWDQDESLYRMWFDGIDTQDFVQIGLANSKDGLVWMKAPDNPVLSGTLGEWDAAGEHAPFILEEGGVYKMWYEGNQAGVPRQLGFASSTDGIVWVKYAGNPVLPAGPETYDNQVAGHGSVLHEGGIYKLWYHAVGDSGVIIAYATSPDGLNWTKQGPVLLPNPSSWDKGLWGPSVIKKDGLYWMWYSAGGTSNPPAIGAATSPDGITWTRVGSAPVLTDPSAIGDPHVLFRNGTFMMWYTNFNNGVIDYAESTDGINWQKSAKNPVLSPGYEFCSVFLPITQRKP